MTKINTGGPAFPNISRDMNEGDIWAWTDGLTLRQWYAGRAPITIADACAVCGFQDVFEAMNTPSQRARVIEAMVALRFAYADAMIAARDEVEP